MRLTISTGELANIISSEIDTRTTNLIYQPLFPILLLSYSRGEILKKTANYPMMASLMAMKNLCAGHGMVYKGIVDYNFNLDYFTVECDGLSTRCG